MWQLVEGAADKQVSQSAKASSLLKGYVIWAIMKTQPIQPHYFLVDQSVVHCVTKGFHMIGPPAAFSRLDLECGRWKRNLVCRRFMIEGVDSSVVASFSNDAKKTRRRHGSKPSKPDYSLTGAQQTVIATSIAAPHANQLSEMEDDEFGGSSDDELSVYRGLVLDLSYRPVNVVCWKRALCLEILEKADVLAYYDQAVMSTTRAFFIPAVLRVSSFIHAPKHKKVKLTLSRNNIFLRDKYRCQYCNIRDSLTIDHVQAASRGGPWSWENLVTACSACNLKKGDKSLEEAQMKLLRPPREPNELDSSDLPPNYKTFQSLRRHSRTPVQWLDYLPRRPPQF